MRIAIAHNDPATVKILSRILENKHEIAWIVQDGQQAVERSLKDRPDLILMGLAMPILDGVKATKAIMLHSPCPIVLVTSDSQENTAKIFEAIGYGALDSVDVETSFSSQQNLLPKILTISKLKGSIRELNKPLNKPINTSLVVFGASTGGPSALSMILAQLPADFPAPIAIVQHIDQQFSSGLAQWLNQQTPLNVRTAQQGDRLRVGEVLLASTNDHLYMREDLTLSYTSEPLNCSYRPSVDVFFESLAKNWRKPGIAILLTGMGKDGAKGLKLLNLKGWYTIAQNETTSAVYGMPKAAVELKAAIAILPLERIATSIKELIKEGKTSR